MSDDCVTKITHLFKTYDDKVENQNRRLATHFKKVEDHIQQINDNVLAFEPYKKELRGSLQKIDNVNSKVETMNASLNHLAELPHISRAINNLCLNFEEIKTGILRQNFSLIGHNLTSSSKIQKVLSTIVLVLIALIFLVFFIILIKNSDTQFTINKDSISIVGGKSDNTKRLPDGQRSTVP